MLQAWLCQPHPSPPDTSKGKKTRYVLKKIKLARQTEWQRASTMQEIKLVG